MVKETSDIEQCCPPFDAELWQEKIFIWEKKKFIKGKVFTILHIPMNFGAVISKLINKTEAANAAIPDWLCLSDHTSKWNMDIYLAVDKDIPEAENVAVSGEFMSKVYEGDFKDTAVWCSDFDAYVKSNGKTIKKMYMWYTTCPKCAKKYGKNYVAIIAEVA